MRPSTITFLATALAATLSLSACGEKSADAPKAEAVAPASTPATGSYKLNFRVDPNPPTGAKENAMHVTVEDSSGKPVADAQVHITLTMPAMPEMKMPEMKNGADLPWTGSDYSAPVQVTMKGGWNVEVEAKRSGEVLGKYETKLDGK